MSNIDFNSPIQKQAFPTKPTVASLKFLSVVGLSGAANVAKPSQLSHRSGLLAKPELSLLSSSSDSSTYEKNSAKPSAFRKMAAYVLQDRIEMFRLADTLGLTSLLAEGAAQFSSALAGKKRTLKEKQELETSIHKGTDALMKRSWTALSGERGYQKYERPVGQDRALYWLATTASIAMPLAGTLGAFNAGKLRGIAQRMKSDLTQDAAAMRIFANRPLQERWLARKVENLASAIRPRTLDDALFANGALPDIVETASSQQRWQKLFTYMKAKVSESSRLIPKRGTVLNNYQCALGGRIKAIRKYLGGMHQTLGTGLARALSALPKDRPITLQDVINALPDKPSTKNLITTLRKSLNEFESLAEQTEPGLASRLLSDLPREEGITHTQIVARLKAIQEAIINHPKTLQLTEVPKPLVVEVRKKAAPKAVKIKIVLNYDSHLAAQHRKIYAKRPYYVALYNRQAPTSVIKGEEIYTELQPISDIRGKIVFMQQAVMNGRLMPEDYQRAMAELSIQSGRRISTAAGNIKERLASLTKLRGEFNESDVNLLGLVIDQIDEMIPQMQKRIEHFGFLGGKPREFIEKTAKEAEAYKLAREHLNIIQPHMIAVPDEARAILKHWLETIQTRNFYVSLKDPKELEIFYGFNTVSR